MSRREVLKALVASVAAGLWSGEALAFGEEGAFHPRLLALDDQPQRADAKAAAGRWAWEVVRRTSAPGRVSVEAVPPARLLEEPFVIWTGDVAPRPLSHSTVRRLREYLRMGGTLVVDDRDPTGGKFLTEAKKQLHRVLPDSAVISLPEDHVLFKTFYLLDGPSGRVGGPGALKGIVRGKNLQVIFLEHDLLGALARTEDGSSWAYPVGPGGAEQREAAIRLSVNIAMYLLCSDYKDDQVHAPFLMRRRHRQR